MLPGPRDTARDLLTAASAMAAAGRPVGHLVQQAAELLEAPAQRAPRRLGAPRLLLN